MKLEAAAWTLAFVMACATACAVVTPPSGPGTEYPCGLRGISCGGGMCCYEGDVCGSDKPGTRCPAGYCCNEGDGILARPKPATRFQ